MKASMLMNLLALFVALPLSAQTIAVFDTVFYTDTHGPRVATMFVPSESNGVGVALGHWWTADRGRMACWGQALAERGYVAMAFDYYDFKVLTTICKYPKPVTTFKLAVEFLRRGAGEFGITTGKIVGLGQSEGAIHWGQSMVWDNDDAFFGTDPTVDDHLDAAVLLYGAYDTEHNLSASGWNLEQTFAPFFSPNPELRYTKGNTIANVENITTPVIMFHGTGDPWIHYLQSVAFHESLTAHGKVSELHIGPWGHNLDVTVSGPSAFTTLGFVVKNIVLAFLEDHVLSQWVDRSSGTTQNLSGVSFIDEHTGTAVGDSGTILRTTDGGATWMSQSSGTTKRLIGVSFVDANTGTVVGGDNPGNGGETAIVLRTTDGGTTWVTQLSTVGYFLEAVCFTDAYTGIAVGWSETFGGKYGHIVGTTDGGITWVDRIEHSSDPYWGRLLHDVTFFDASNGTAVGRGGTVLRTTDGGATWENQSSGTSLDLHGVTSFTNPNTITAVGDSGIVLHTTDGGDTWVSQPSGTTENLLDVSFPSLDEGIVVGESGTILRSNDGGTTWGCRKSGTMEQLRAVHYNDYSCGIVVGTGGTVLCKAVGVVTSVREDARIGGTIPTGFALQQNYPNPFNPSTTIKYHLPRALHVTLTVYDLLGREIATLVNAVEEPGYKSVEWNASAVASGVYFYRLTAGDFVQTRKLLLLR